MDWVGYVAGQTTGGGLIKNVSGSDSIAITTNAPLEALGDICTVLLGAFESQQYRERFPFIDYLSPIPEHDPAFSTLNDRVISMLGRRAYERISVAYPEIPDFERMDHLKIWDASLQMEIEDLSLSPVYEFLDKAGGAPDPFRTYVVVLDSGGHAIMRKRALWDFLVSEVELDGRTYVLSLGHWFAVDQPFVDRLRKDMQQIPDLTGELCMPDMLGGEREDHYNTRVAREKGWLALDKRMAPVDSPYARVEVCDLITDVLHFVAVKKTPSSATLSHLFAQGLVSATLLKGDQSYRRWVMDEILGKWPGKTDADTDGKPFVFAVATEKAGPLTESLFFFSQINLIQQKDAIERMGYRVGLCKITQQKPGASAVKKTKRRGKGGVPAAAKTTRKGA
ncbi:MAG: DUF6119 family protein [Bacillota bacterium]